MHLQMYYFLISVIFLRPNVLIGDCLDLSVPYSCHHLRRDRPNRVKWMIHGINPEVLWLGKDAICSVSVLLIHIGDREYNNASNQKLYQKEIVLLWIIPCTVKFLMYATTNSKT